jgi:hypothetical protein
MAVPMHVDCQGKCEYTVDAIHVSSVAEVTSTVGVYGYYNKRCTLNTQDGSQKPEVEGEGS